MRISAIVAMSENRVIGKDNQLPWRLRADLQRVKRLTMGKPIIMGRKTHESIGRVLPGRKNIILTRKSDFFVPDAVVVHSLEEALNAAGEAEEIFIFGGAELYREFWPRLQRIYMTLVHINIEGDAFFPELNKERWKEVQREEWPAEGEDLAYTTITWDLLPPAQSS